MKVHRALLAAAFIAAACSPTTEAMRDRLDTALIVGLGPAPEGLVRRCVRKVSVYTLTVSNRADCGELSFKIDPRTSIAVWAIALNSRDVEKPIGGKSISYEVVDRDGVTVPREFAYITPNSAITGQSGFVEELVSIVALRSGVYRVRANYLDRKSSAFSYSPNLIVQSN